jgi:hypothetical protein
MIPSKNVIESVEKKMQEDSKTVYSNLMESLIKDSENIPSEITVKQIGEALETFSDKVNISQNTKNTILNYKLVDNIIEGKVTSYNPSSFDEKNFVDFFSGKDLKNILFECSLDEKKDKVELLTNLYGMIGGNNNGITKENLIKSLKNFYSLIKNDKNNNDNEINKKAEKEAEEIIEFLGENAESISLNDFINMMTSDSHYDNIPDEDLNI